METAANYLSTPKYLISDRSKIFGITNGERSKMTFGAVNVLSLIRSISYDRMHNLNQSYVDIAHTLGCGRTTVARAVSMIKKYALADITASKLSSVYTFKFDKEKEHEDFYRAEYWFYTRTLHFKYVRRKDDTVDVIEEDRKLRPSESRVLSIIYTYCTNEKTGTKSYSASMRELSAESGLSERSVKSAVAALIAARLIARKKKACGKLSRSTYTLVSRNFERLNKKQAQNSPQKAKYSEVEELDARAERESFYAKRRAEAEAEADKLKNHFFKNIKFSNLCKRESELTVALAKATVFNMRERDTLKSEYEHVKKDKLAILAIEGYDLSDLEPDYYCKKCSDTGFLPNGRACDCYKEK